MSGVAIALVCVASGLAIISATAFVVAYRRRTGPRRKG